MLKYNSNAQNQTQWQNSLKNFFKKKFRLETSNYNEIKNVKNEKKNNKQQQQQKKKTTKYK